MKYVERLLISVSMILLLGIAGLGLFWMVLLGKMVLFGSPVAEQTRFSTFVATDANDAATAQPEQVVQAPAETRATPATEPAGEGAGILASADAGETVFKKCKACHSADSAATNKVGPALWSVVGRQIASVEGFVYSDALKTLQPQVWDVDTLSAFLANPKTYAPGNKMAFAGLKKEQDVVNLIAYLGQQSDSPLDAAALGFAAAGADAIPAAAESAGDTEPAVVEIDPVPYPEGVTYRNPPARSAAEQAEIDKLAADLAALAPTLDYERARHHPLHFPPQAAEASNEECLVCHQEIMTHQPRNASPAGIPVGATLAWYQTLDTYAGDQESFHYRHLESDFAKQVMNLECSFCHKGNDPREESPDMVPTRTAMSAAPTPEFTLRKMVNPSETCLRCHGAMPAPEEIMGLAGPWHEVREDMEWPEAPNGCLSCHAESFRTVRHDVSYLNAKTIEEIAREGSSDSCYGCHGGRSWFRISYPYPRNPWPGMDDTETPEWATDRPTQSDPEYALPAAE